MTEEQIKAVFDEIAELANRGKDDPAERYRILRSIVTKIGSIMREFHHVSYSTLELTLPPRPQTRLKKVGRAWRELGRRAAMHTGLDRK
jgi:hypothetical protein